MDSQTHSRRSKYVPRSAWSLLNKIKTCLQHASTCETPLVPWHMRPWNCLITEPRAETELCQAKRHFDHKIFLYMSAADWRGKETCGTNAPGELDRESVFRLEGGGKKQLTTLNIGDTKLVRNERDTFVVGYLLLLGPLVFCLLSSWLQLMCDASIRREEKKHNPRIQKKDWE